MAVPTDGRAERQLPLAGIRVLEIGQVISGPYAGLLLADLGAEVTKVEPPGTGDSTRNPAVTAMGGKSATFLTLNRNKRSICLDLRDPADQATLRSEVAASDVVLSNMVPGTATRLGVDPETLSAVNPAVIVCRVLGFRADHPLVDEPSFDLTHQALNGYMTMGGLPGDPPSRVPIPIADLAVAQFAVNAILAALFNRQRTGLGEHIDVPMSDVLLSLLTYQATLYLNQGDVPERLGSAHPHTIPWQAFAASDGHFVVAVRSHRFWERLCTAIGRSDLLSDDRFTTNPDRLAHRVDLDKILADAFAERTVRAWLELLRVAGVPSAPVRDIGEALQAEVDADSPLIQEFEDPDLGPVKVVGNPIRFTRMQVARPAAAPRLGEHS
ncbi:MAG: CoA transferase [Frankiales bacterium]|nr:CoA transferase [Frankiales bacterium]